ncbi:MAG: WD40 repeat domain-containing protein, partial [Verrucomicrobiota bacterium]
MIRVFRPPLSGEGGAEKLISGSLSPTAELCAVGMTAQGNSDPARIFVFETRSGRIVQVLRTLPEAPFDLEFSEDGTLLAGGFAGTGGLRVWQVEGWKELVRDGNYEDSCNSVVWTGASRLISGSADGVLRAYDPRSQVKAARKVDGANVIVPLQSAVCSSKQRIASLAITPDGGGVMVAFQGGNALELRSLQDFAKVREYSSDVVSNGNISSVAVSADLVLAGGRWQEQQVYQFQSWWLTGAEPSKSFGGPQNTILDISSLGEGRFCFASADPAWGIIDASAASSTERFFLLGSPCIADYRNNKPGLLISRDGYQVSFAFESWGKRPATFSIQKRELNLLKQGETLNHALVGPRYEGVPLSGWMAEANPVDFRRFLDQGIPEGAITRGDKPLLKISDQSVVLDKGERSTCAAISDDR